MTRQLRGNLFAATSQTLVAFLFVGMITVLCAGSAPALAAADGANGQTTPTITWATPAAITYGKALSAKQLDATTTVAGTFVYTPAAGTVLGAGMQTLSVTFTPTDSVDYTSATATVPLTVAPAVLRFDAFNYTRIYGEALPVFGYSITGYVNGDTASTAFSGAPSVTSSAVKGSPVGSYPITPTAGTLSSSNYTFRFGAATFTINPARLAFAAFSYTRRYGQALPAPIGYDVTGYENGDTAATAFTGAPSVTSTVPQGSPLGTYTITVAAGSLKSTNYTFVFFNGTLTIFGIPVIHWATPAAIPYGTLLSATQLDATSTVAGTFAYTPTAGALLDGGTHTLSVTFTPADTADYTSPTATVQLTVYPIAPGIRWAWPAAISYGTALSATQLDASSTVAGTFVYTPAAGTVPTGGAHTLSVTLTPTSTTDYTSATATVQLTVNPVLPVVKLTSSTSTVALGAPVTFTATLTGAGVTPTGTVTFFQGATNLGAGTLSGGVAASTVDMPTAGSPSITASYSGDSNYTPATSAALTLTVNKGTPAISLKSSAGTAALGAPVTFTATLTGSGVTPTGSVTFLDGTTKLGTGTLGSNGVASDSTSALALGAHSISASYSGDSNYTAVTSTALTETVTSGPPATTTALAVTSEGSQVTTVDSGSVVTLTATVNASGTPVTPGLVDFCDAAAKYCTDIHIVGTAQLTKDGTATFKFRPGIGTRSYKAVFLGTRNDTTSSSATATLEVTGLHRSATVFAQAGGAGDYKLTATVGGNGSAEPTGTVSFLDTSNGDAVLGTASLVAGAAGLNFLNSSNPHLGGFPQQIWVADFNLNGILDLAVPNGDENAVNILMGKGDGTFMATAISPPTGDYPLAIAGGDFNGDGLQDLVVVNNSYSGGGTLTLLLSNGDGTFTTSTIPGTFEGPRSIAVGDFNGDGIADLAVGCEHNDTVTVLLGNGDGTFTRAATSPATGSEPYSIAVADFNGDGNLDLAVANAGSDTVTVLLGNGDGTFTASPKSPATGSMPFGIVVADFNGDGIPDLAISNTGGTTVTVLLGNGDGTFEAPKTIPVGGGPWPITVGDFNGDGIPDLATGNSGTVTVLLGNGDGTFKANAVSPAIGGFAIGIKEGDFNGDGTADLAVADGGGNASVLLTENQTATATAAAVAVPGSGTHQIVAKYSGDSNYAASTSAPVAVAAGNSASGAQARRP